MNQETLNTLLLLLPLLIGGIIAAINSDSTNNFTENAEGWVRKTQKNTSVSQGNFSRYIVNPVLWLIVKFSDWTDGFVHRGLKNGTRVAATIYLLAAWCYLIFAAFMVIVALVIGSIVLYAVFIYLINSNSDFKRGFEKSRRLIGSTGPGTRINQETGVIQEKGFFGWNDTDKRIDADGKLQEKGFLGWNDTDTKIDQETGNIQKKGFLGYNDTKTRVNPETGVIEKNGFLGWNETNERINPKTGRRQKNGLLGWEDE